MWKALIWEGLANKSRQLRPDRPVAWLCIGLLCIFADFPNFSSPAEILGALLSVLSIWVVTGVLVYLAIERLLSGEYEIDGEAMLITSACAVAVNLMYVGITFKSCEKERFLTDGRVTLTAGHGRLKKGLLEILTWGPTKSGLNQRKSPIFLADL